MIFLGVDGGQSSTTAWIGDEAGTLLGSGVAGPCNHVSGAEGASKLKRVVTECVGNACREAGLNPSQVTFRAACFGMSGGPADKVELLSGLIGAETLVVTDDAAIAHAGALGGQPGIVTIAGTGSIAFGRDVDGRRCRAGGWGYVFGDEGGAFDIVRQALRAALRNEEGWGAATGLHAALLRHTGLADANSVLHAFYTSEWPRSRVAGFAPVVDELATSGDSVAAEILNEAALDLAGLAMAVRERLWECRAQVRCSFIGGVFASKLVRSGYKETLERGGAIVTPPLAKAVAGALLHAYKAAGITPDFDKLIR